MKPSAKPHQIPLFLGIEAGATRSVAILADAKDRSLRRVEGKVPANLRLLGDARLIGFLGDIAGQFPRPMAVGIGMAGALGVGDRDRIRAAAAQIWPGIPCWAGNDLEAALAAARDGSAPAKLVRVVVMSGTGTSCHGKRADGGDVFTGGRGHLLGDRGSGYDIALRALQAVFRTLDATGRWPALGRRFLRVLKLRSPEELIAWTGGASEAGIAALAVELFAAAAGRDKIALEILAESADLISCAAIACARRLARKGSPVEFVLTGGVLRKQPGFARRVTARLKAAWPGARVKLLASEGALGAVRLAQQLAPAPAESAGSHGRSESMPATADVIPGLRGPSPTEQRNPLSRKLDRMPVSAAVRLMLSEDAKIPAALLREEKKITRAVRLIVRAYRRGGRLIYVGAGTSGRLGALDAVECPPTFGVPPEMTLAIVAGGDRALSGAQEDAEDDVEGGARAVRGRGVSRDDVVLGISASGRTPFVWGALRAAREAGANTILLCFNPNLVFRRGTRPTLVIAPEIGPELLTGSTRLKAGTATKLLLNIFTTLAMVRMGKVIENLMVDVRPTNAKLRDRAIRIVQELTRAARPEVVNELRRSAWSVKRAIATLKK